MFCENCGAKMSADAIKCAQCGSKVAQEPAEQVPFSSLANEETGATAEATELVESADDDVQYQSRSTVRSTTASRSKPRRNPLLWVGAAVIVGAIGVGGYFATSKYMGNRAAHNALLAANSGNFALAVADQQRAQHWNPRDSRISSQLTLYSTALQSRNKIDTAKHFLETQQYDQALKGYADAQSILSAHSSPLYSPLTTDIKSGKERANIGLIEQDSAKSSNIATVADDYERLNTYHDSVGVAAQKNVRSHLESLVTQDVQRKIEANDFSDAIQEIQTLTQSVPKDAVLAKLGNQIKTAQTSYEQKQQRIEEQSLAQAANLANLNANPIQVVNVSIADDGLGDTVATGTVNNQGTNIIGAIELTIAFYDNTQTQVDTEYVGVNPDPMTPGSQSTFSISIPNFYGATSASVTNATWMNE